jgi:hypothetical protein
MRWFFKEVWVPEWYTEIPMCSVQKGLSIKEKDW